MEIRDRPGTLYKLVDPRPKVHPLIVARRVSFCGWRATSRWYLGAGPMPSAVRHSRRAILSAQGSERVRRLLRRKRLDNLLDWVRFRIDTFPRNERLVARLGLPYYVTNYQSLPWVGLRSGTRASGTESRLAAMLPDLERCEVESALDVGGHVGWFAFEFARRGIDTVVVEREDRAIRVGLYAREKAGLSQVSFLVMDVQPGNAFLLPEVDCTLMLSIWHHLVRESGVEAATEVLGASWQKTRKVLFFDTGAAEMPPDWGLPNMKPEPKVWLRRYLTKACPNGEVVDLGEHDAFGPDNEPVRRTLFAVIKSSG
ncbi:MAG TPA: hypothetical protein VFM13_05215 [Gaiellaceae bacterium]|nr:hypothetical protein [Gaiellaceae bacterium]